MILLIHLASGQRNGFPSSTERIWDFYNFYVIVAWLCDSKGNTFLPVENASGSGLRTQEEMYSLREFMYPISDSS
jgi:hypothetical protein